VQSTKWLFQNTQKFNVIKMERPILVCVVSRIIAGR